MTNKKKGDCCPVMTLVLERAAQNPQPIGIHLGHFFYVTTGKRGKTGSRPIVYFKRMKRAKGEAKEPSDDATYAPFNFCPFCGSKLGEAL